MTSSLDDKQKGKEEEDRVKAQRLLERVSKVHKEVEEQLQKSQQHNDIGLVMTNIGSNMTSMKVIWFC